VNRRCISVLATVVATTGCDDNPSNAQVASAPVKPKHGLTIDDVHIATKAALVTGTEGESALRVTVSTDNLDCDAITGAYPERPASGSGKRLDFWLAQPLETDGSHGPWTFRSAFMTDADGGRGVVTRAAQLDDVIEMPDRVTVKGLEIAGQDHKALLGWQGPLVANNCGRVKRKEEARPQQGLKLSIAGQSFSIHGASVRPQAGQYFLRLTRAPHRCASVFTEGYDFYMDLALKGDPPKVQFAALLGDMFPGDPSGSKGKESFELKAAGRLDEVGDVTIDMSGTLDIGGYVTKVAGEVDARRCVPL